jgi:hypothetical protein
MVHGLLGLYSTKVENGLDLDEPQTRISNAIRWQVNHVGIAAVSEVAWFRHSSELAQLDWGKNSESKHC